MNYETNIKHTYHIESDMFNETQGAYLMLANGDIHYVDYDNIESGAPAEYETLMYYYANYANRNYDSYANMMLYYSELSGCFYLFMRNNIDYVVFNALGSQITNYALIAMDENDTPIEGARAVDTYPQYGALTSFSDYSYGTQIVTNFTQAKVITDLSNIKAHNGIYGDYTQHQLVVRGENVAYSMFAVEISTLSFSGLDISYGSPYYDIKEQARADGYGDGYSNGWVQGQRYGFEQGLASNIDPNANTAFGYIGQAFNCVTGILNLEVLPHVTLGLCFSIPLTFVLIMTIFKLVKK